MLKLLRVVLRLFLVIPWILFGLLCVGLAYPFMSLPARAGLNRFWSRCLMRMCGIRVAVSGEALRSGPVLWVANHVSWIDISWSIRCAPPPSWPRARSAPGP